MAAAGYSGKPLEQKLGVKEGTVLVAFNPPAAYGELFSELPKDVVVRRVYGTRPSPATGDLVHLFVEDKAALAAAARRALAAVAPGGMLWVSWPKKSSALFRDLTEDGVREVMLPTGWVDVKVCAVDADWSGLKFLRRKAGG